MKPILFSLFESDAKKNALANALSADVGKIEIRNFPDQESYLRFESDVADRDIIFYDTLSNVNKKIIPLLFSARIAKSLGAKRVGLCAPYLAYMRQDKIFHPGEGINARYFAEIISAHFDWLVTVDPHLHRIHNLNAIYTIPTCVLHATLPMSQWITENINNAVLIGPDAESVQWVSEIATQCNAPYLILTKKRFSDRHVEVSIPAMEKYTDHTPVLIDDIISSGETMIAAILKLKKLNTHAPVCVAVHGVFDPSASEKIVQAGAKKIITCDTINQNEKEFIQIEAILAHGIKKQIA